MNIVSSYDIIQVFKRSKYFKVSLGLVSTNEISNGSRIYNKDDNFAFRYNMYYKTTIYGQGKIGDINFYTDHYIKDKKIAIYYNDEEFIWDYNEKMVKENGVDSYIGFLLKSTKDEYTLRIEREEMSKKLKEEGKSVDPEKLIDNPGSVTYEDVKAYLDKKRRERL